MSSISFVHLSDIHFTRYSGDAYDLDQDLRNELFRDINQNAKQNLTNIKGVLVCGDIAFSGQSPEYKVASEFLSEVCDSIGIPQEAVYCVPGNHDVDQSIPTKSAIIKTIQDKIAEAKTQVEIDRILTKYSRDTEFNNLLYAPIKCYNTEFAGKFKCYITPEKPTWEFDFEIGEKYTLRLFGLNSTVISNADDHASDVIGDRPMVIGQYQIPSRTDNGIYLTLCHHPPECWQDTGNYLKHRMDSRIQIQLYGHKHIQTIQKTEETLIICSGATHPTRGEEYWNPRYNWILLEVMTSQGADFLNVRVFPRVLDDKGDRFVADIELCQNKVYVEYQIPLPSESDELFKKSSALKAPPQEPSKEVDIKSLTYTFLSLPYVTRDKIIAKLFLGREEDEGFKHVEIIDTLLKRAEKKGCIQQLREEIENSRK